MQDEREPLGGLERLEDNEQREPDGVGQERLVLRVGAVGAVDDRLREAHVERFLTPRPARAQHVQRDARDDGRQPAAEVLHLVGVGPVEAQPRLLDGVVGLAQRAEHPVGDGAQPGPVLFEVLRQEIALVHVSHPLVGVGHGFDPRRAGDVTEGERPCQPW